MKRPQDPMRFQLNKAVIKLAKRDRAQAVALLAKFDALRTTELMLEQLRPALDAFEGALAKLDASVES